MTNIHSSDRDVVEAAFFGGLNASLGYVNRLAKEIWHKTNACSCDQGYFLPGKPCEIGLEEIEVRKAARLFAEWDALGLGYIGPRI